MKVISLAVAGVCLTLIALTLVPAAGEYRPALSVAALVCAAVVLAIIAMGPRAAGRRETTSVTQPAAAEAPRPVAVNAPRPAAPSAIANTPPAPAVPVSAQAQVIGFLALLQEKGRFIDFVQDDITGYSDSQVGAAARVVHQGCAAALREVLSIVPIREENEGVKVTIPAGYAADEYRLTGKIGGEAPFSGTLVHRGWKAASVALPRLLQPDANRLPTIAPAEVELR